MQATTIATTVLLLVAVAWAQDYDYEASVPARPAPARINPGYTGQSKASPQPPVAILKQINRHNEDGSYTYGYEGGDGSFKIETKLPNGEVKGKYGYTDETGKLRVVEYGANRYGFQPAGEGITVAPPTLVDETTNKDGTLNEYADNGQYFAPAPAPAPVRAAPRPKIAPAPQPQYVQEFSQPRFAPAPQHSPSPVPARAQIPGAIPSGPAPIHTFSPAPRPQLSHAPQRFAPAPVEEDITYAEPAPRPAPRLTFSQPAPQPYRPPAQPAYRPPPQPQPAFRPAPQQSGRVGGILDQLAKDYALPADAPAALHDISFGYY